MSLVATCPNCGTVFSMVREQLEASDGQVRCGHCMVVFDATRPLAPKPDSEQAHLEHANPEQALAADIAPATSQEDLSFVQQAKKQAFWSQKSVIISLVIVSFLLSLLLGFQVLRTESERITQAVPALKPIAHTLCSFASCTKNKRMQIDGWRIESSSFQKEGVDSFRLALQLKNTHSESLLIPHLELSLLDATDSLLVRKSMTISTQSESITAGEERIFTFFITPESNLTTKVSGYKLVLFYP